MKTHFKAQKLGRQGHYFGGENQSCAVCKTTSGQEEGEKKSINPCLVPVENTAGETAPEGVKNPSSGYFERI